MKMKKMVKITNSFILTILIWYIDVSFIDPEKEKRNAEMKFFGAISAVALIVFLFLPNMGRNEDQMGNNQDVAKSGTTTYNEFFHTMLQAGEVQEIVIAPALNR